jgi:hypothetical protein
MDRGKPLSVIHSCMLNLDCGGRSIYRASGAQASGAQASGPGRSSEPSNFISKPWQIREGFRESWKAKVTVAGVGEARRGVAPTSVSAAAHRPLHCRVQHLTSAFRPGCPAPDLPPSAAKRTRACLFSILRGGKRLSSTVWENGGFIFIFYGRVCTTGCFRNPWGHCQFDGSRHQQVHTLRNFSFSEMKI